MRNSEKLEKKVAAFIIANKLICPQDRILLAISGGADSTAMLYILARLRQNGFLDAKFICGHINHLLRQNESYRDEDFAARQAEKLGLQIVIRRVNVKEYAEKNKLSIETAARDLRIKNLLEIARGVNCRLIATAHQKNDNAETIIHRLLRGTGLRGICGIWPKKPFEDDISFIRPLLIVSREEIIEYLKGQDLKWQTDKTNLLCCYRRNYIRHKLLTQIQKDCRGRLADMLCELADSAINLQRKTQAAAEQIWATSVSSTGSKVMLDSKCFLQQAPAVRAELIRKSLATIGSGERDLRREHYQKIAQLAGRGESGKKIELPTGYAAEIEYGRLIFQKNEIKRRQEDQTKQQCKLHLPGLTVFNGHSIAAEIIEAENVNIGKLLAEKTESVEYLDWGKTRLPLNVRYRDRADRFRPLGLKTEKKTGKFLTDQKVPADLRQKTLVIADSEKIIWLWPVRIAEDAKIDSGTKKILKLEIKYQPQG